ncbi:hypothetical protein [Brevibacterium sp. RIT 803]|uniref:hypothetical protein n=1 Tax=Brevibacterium sp. RIT 803 TaxID=2810210 RepID=UPI00194DB4CD|nr:hypothetical protein [Brevibacterium sp. RIT 803]MBM6588812.1 hypothetical protein [Brevibacterium sp. RIT 803]
MMHFNAKTATVNHINGELHVEFTTIKGKQVIGVLADGAGAQFLNDVEDAVLEQSHYRDRGAAFPLDRGAA